MIVVLQCAGTKRNDALTFSQADGRKVKCVARPDEAPPSAGFTYAHPDGMADLTRTWRQAVSETNQGHDGSSKLHRAFELDEPPASPTLYRELVSVLGLDRVYILSAGWGLIRSDYGLPDYDITFAPEALKKAPWKYRGRRDKFEDYMQLPAAETDSLMFIGSKAYLPQFLTLTKSYRGKRTVFYNSITRPTAPGCATELFPSRNRRTWQYECALKLLE